MKISKNKQEGSIEIKCGIKYEQVDTDGGTGLIAVCSREIRKKKGTIQLGLGTFTSRNFKFQKNYSISRSKNLS